MAHSTSKPGRVPNRTLSPNPSSALPRDAVRPAAGLKVLYVVGAPVDLVDVHARYRAAAGEGKFRGQSSLVDLFSMCERHDMQMHVISSHERAEVSLRGRFTLEHRPRRGSSGLRYYAQDVASGVHMVRRARELSADVVVVESGTVHFFVMAMLQAAGFRVVPLIHHALWAPGHPPKSLRRRAVRWANRRFFRHAAKSAICVSPACARQVRQEAGDALPVHEIRLQLDKQAFADIGAPPALEREPFGVIYTGRIESDKGVFDMVEMIDMLEAERPGKVRWFILGEGSARPRLAATLVSRGLAHRVEMPGHVSPEQMAAYYRRAHVAIVPTRAEIGEGMAMAAVEAVIVGRPVVTSAVVPALEILRPACAEARVDDVGSYVSALRTLMTNTTIYESKRAACAGLGDEFFDRRRGLAAVVERVLATEIKPQRIAGRPSTPRPRRD